MVDIPDYVTCFIQTDQTANAVPLQTAHILFDVDLQMKAGIRRTSSHVASKNKHRPG